MKLRSKAAVVAATVALAACSKPVEEVVVNAGSKEGLTQTLEMIKKEYGPDAAESVVEDMALIVGNYFSDPVLDEAYSRGETAVVIDKIDRLRDEALEKIDGATVEQLQLQAEPLEHAYKMERKKKAMPRLEAFQAEKERVMAVRGLRSSLQIDSPKIQIGQDEFGYMQPRLALTLTNNSESHIRALDLDVHAWDSRNEDINGDAHVRLGFEESVAPGESRQVVKALSPLSTLSHAVTKGAGNGTRIKMMVVYSEEDGRTEMSALWTPEMEENLQRLSKYAAYDE